MGWVKLSKLNERELEDLYASNPIPSDLRKSWFGVMVIYFGMTASLAAFVTGGSLVTGLTIGQALIAIMLGSVLLVVIYGLMGYVGLKEGVNTYIIGESAFGTKGSRLISAFVITIIPCVGWYGIQVAIASDAIILALGLNDNLSPLLIILMGILFVLPAMYGLNSMAWLDYISVPIILFVTAFGLFKVFSLTGYDGIINFTPNEPHSIVWGTNLVIATMLVGAVFAADYTRWTKRRVSSVIYSGSLGIALPMIFLTAIGVIMALTATGLGVDEPWNIAQVLFTLGFPSLSLIMVIVLQWTSNVTGAYSSGLALTKVFGGNRTWWTFIAAMVGTLLAVSGIIHHFISFLNLIAIFVAPAGGVIIVEYFFVQNQHLNQKGQFYWPGILSWLIGGFSAYLIPFFIGSINGLLIAGGLYYIYHLIFSRKSKVTSPQQNISS